MDLEAQSEALKATIRNVPDFPKPGVVFKDITTLLRDRASFRLAIDLLAALSKDLHADQVVAIESRGFILGSALADRLGLGFVPLRKPGKLPAGVFRAAYELEYGSDFLEMHNDALRRREKALIVDDVIATGGTARAAAELVQQAGASVAAFVFLVELTFLSGRAKLDGYEVRSLLRY